MRLLHAFAAAGVLLSAGLVGLAARGPAALPPKAKPLRLVFSGELNGHLTPCGCTKPMLGGLPRRATALRAIPTDQRLCVEGGDLVDRADRQSEMKAEAEADALAAMGYDAVGVGEKDLRLGVAFLQSLDARMRGRFVCANLVSSDGRTVFRDSRLVARSQGAAQRRVLIVGALGEDFAQDESVRREGLRVTAPAAAVVRALAVARGKVDGRVLLLHGSRDEARAIARQCPTLDVIVCAHEGDIAVPLGREGRTVLLCGGGNGKEVGVLSWGQAVPTRVALGPKFGEDVATLRMKQAYVARVTAEGLLAQTPMLPTENGDRYAGSAACVGCHADAATAWQHSGHAGALTTLQRVGESGDPECIPCHVVGFGRSSGFQSGAATPGLGGVGCESCHGPAARHAASPATPMPRVGEAACRSCHVAEHSPGFDFATYWPRVRH